jgi:hypothetical protein
MLGVGVQANIAEMKALRCRIAAVLMEEDCRFTTKTALPNDTLDEERHPSV